MSASYIDQVSDDKISVETKAYRLRFFSLSS